MRTLAIEVSDRVYEMVEDLAARHDTTPQNYLEILLLTQLVAEQREILASVRRLEDAVK